MAEHSNLFLKEGSGFERQVGISFVLSFLLADSSLGEGGLGSGAVVKYGKL